MHSKDLTVELIIVALSAILKDCRDIESKAARDQTYREAIEKYDAEAKRRALIRPKERVR